MSGHHLLAGFAEPGELMDAIKEAREAGFSDLEAYSPFAIEGVAEAIGHRPTRIRLVMAVAGVIGAACGFGLQAWSAVVAYPINSGGRPLFSWPAFMLVTFELTVLFAVVAGFVAFILRSGLTQLHQPLFAAPNFHRASHDLFFLRVTVDGDANAARNLLQGLSPIVIDEVPA
ncbi:DUF3341 domain-containing protein [Afifella sp. YEN Y35]|uniref:DUF3341 domain-containing protein n=1 Tax=Afifella sp. YEN Y35 TaxID=3388337 RepID=UPI0039E0E4F3